MVKNSIFDFSRVCAVLQVVLVGRAFLAVLTFETAVVS